MNHEYFRLPKNYVGLILGKKMSRIRSIEIKFGVKILYIDDQFSIYSKSSHKNCLDAKNYIVSIYTKKILEENECPICLEKIDCEKNYIITDCGHRFHSKCIFESMKKNNKCPICREKLVEDKKEEIDIIIEKTIRFMRRSNYLMSNFTYLCYYLYDVFSFQVVMEELIKEPLRYALNQFNNS